MMVVGLFGCVVGASRSSICASLIIVVMMRVLMLVVVWSVSSVSSRVGWFMLLILFLVVRMVLGMLV